MNDGKAIFDPIHGGIRISGVYLDMLDRPEMQRLRAVRQLDMAYMVYPGANHTRFEHCLGVYHLAGRMADSLELSDEDRRSVMMAGLLHDCCHHPFSHTLEEISVERMGMDHMDLARKLIMGEIPYYNPRDEDLCGDMPPMSQILEDNGISAKRVCDLIDHPRSIRGEDIIGGKSFFPTGDYVHQIIHGPIDADQMDYLMRDAHYTGVNWGAIDLERILQTIQVHNDQIVMRRGGYVAAEGLMVARSLMYSAVYFHTTVRIIKQMLTKAFECSDLKIEELHTWDDMSLISALIDQGGKCSELTRRAMGRRMYKACTLFYDEDQDEDTYARLSEFCNYKGKKKLESEIAERAGVDITDVIVDMPPRSSLLSKSKVGKTDVQILDTNGKLRPLSRYSPIAKGLQSRDPYGWKFMVACPLELSEKVDKATHRVLNL